MVNHTEGIPQINAVTLYQGDGVLDVATTFTAQDETDYRTVLFEFMIGLMTSRRFTRDEIYAVFQSHRTLEGDKHFYLFDFINAYHYVMNRCASYPSEQRVYSNGYRPQNTRKAYQRDLAKFIIYLFERHALPHEGLIQAYIADLKKAGQKAVSITRGMAPVRTFCTTLAYQVAPAWMPLDDRYSFQEKQKAVLRGNEVRNPKPEIRHSKGKLFTVGTRLSVEEINQVLLSIKTDPRRLVSLRDYALFKVGIESGLRCESLMDLTPDDFIRSVDGYWKLKAIGKGGKFYDPTISEVTKAAVDSWIVAYNEGLSSDDPRTIRQDTRIWQPLTKSGNRSPRGRAEDGINHYSIYNIVHNRAAAVGLRISPHDLRRSCAANLMRVGAPLEAIQQKLGHEDISTTMRYVGKHEDNAAQSFDTYGIVFA